MDVPGLQEHTEELSLTGCAYGHTTFSYRNLPCFVWMESCLVLVKNSGAEFEILTGMHKERLTASQGEIGQNKLEQTWQTLLLQHHHGFGLRTVPSAKHR